VIEEGLDVMRQLALQGPTPPPELLDDRFDLE